MARDLDAVELESRLPVLLAETLAHTLLDHKENTFPVVDNKAERKADFPDLESDQAQSPDRNLADTLASCFKKIAENAVAQTTSIQPVFAVLGSLVAKSQVVLLEE